MVSIGDGKVCDRRGAPVVAGGIKAVCCGGGDVDLAKDDVSTEALGDMERRGFGIGGVDAICGKML